jgi:RNA polymerase sigma-70 factor (ECF subfamily)
MPSSEATRASDETTLVQALRRGDEQSFAAVVDAYSPALLRLATTFVRTRAVAEEVVQDTWYGVVKGINRFEGRSSLKTWLFRILVNRARSAGRREPRHVPLEPNGPAVAPERFGPDGGWSDPPTPWPDDAEDRILAQETVEQVVACLDQLPEQQRQVVVLRDFEGLPSTEVCELLGVTEANQRVLLHRGRSRIRALLEATVAER